MLHFFYNLLAVILFPFLLPVLILLLLKKKYRTGLANRLGFVPETPKSAKRVIWFHAVSVGEVMAAIPLITHYRKTCPDSYILLSTVTVTGHNTAADKLELSSSGALPGSTPACSPVSINRLIYFPFDFFLLVALAAGRIRPNLFIFFETEIWPNILHTMKRRGTPSLLVNGRLSRRSFNRYKRLGFLWRRVLDDISRLSLQTIRDKELFTGLGVEESRISVTGNMKYEQVLKNPGVPPAVFKRFNTEQIKNIVVFGSTHEGEEAIVLDVLSRMKGGVYPVIAPRHPERLAAVERLIGQHGFKLLKRSQINRSTRFAEYDIIMLDTIGELSGTYSYADIVFIGGSLVPVGGHNILEAASWGKVVVFGQYMANIADISREFINRSAALKVTNADELYNTLQMLLADRALMKEMGGNGLKIVQENQGAVNRNITIIDEAMSGSISA